ncbi:MAG: hypothetical protein H8D45_24675 [Bacteroidetes bacterium]|nr:hypothetical protein [Bacteroidota bacterium]MBL7105244.1 hypothetical protein [Bacteroidales bacterium]
MKIEMNPNEMVIKANDSSQVLNGSSIKGKLILTNQRLYFKASDNGKRHNDVEIMPDDIKEVMLFNNRILFSTGLNIVTDDGIENKFLVKNRNDWSEMIVRMC